MSVSFAEPTPEVANQSTPENPEGKDVNGDWRAGPRVLDSMMKWAGALIQPSVTTSDVNGVVIVCISDTHNKHRDLTVPDGDILIHAGDFTLYGKEEHAVDFNSWLGTLPHRHKIVVNGNHENNAEWKARTPEILSNATFLRQSSVTVEGLLIFGCEFFWPVAKGGVNAYYEQIPKDAAVIITHGPVHGYVDGGSGCRAMLSVVKGMCRGARAGPEQQPGAGPEQEPGAGPEQGLEQEPAEVPAPAPAPVSPPPAASARTPSGLKLVVSGHVHRAHGLAAGSWLGGCSGVTFVNAANCGDRTIEFEPVVVCV